MNKRRVNVYIDGFNLYYGMCDALKTNFKWLNVHDLAQKLLKSDQELKSIYYFTSIIKNNPAKSTRQQAYLGALSTLTSVQIIYGQYQKNTVTCKVCQHSWRNDNEKMTDVNIATHLLSDAYNDCFDTAILISGDSDLVPPLNAIAQVRPKKSVVAAFPPKRVSSEIKKILYNKCISISTQDILKSQFQPTVNNYTNGHTYNKPLGW